MGEYGVYIWPSYGVTALVMLAMGMVAILRLQRAKRILASLSDPNET